MTAPVSVETMPRAYLGIAPGERGAVALVGEDMEPAVWDTPLFKGDDGQVVVLAPETCQLLEQAYVLGVRAKGHVHVVLEHQRGGYGYGLWQGLLIASDMPYTVVPPAQWKREYGAPVSPQDDFARRVARQLFPELPSRSAGRAEALLIAEYGRRQLRLMTQIPEML